MTSNPLIRVLSKPSLRNLVETHWTSGQLLQEKFYIKLDTEYVKNPPEWDQLTLSAVES